MIVKKLHIISLLITAVMGVVVSSCSDEARTDIEPMSDEAIQVGEPVLFSACMPQLSSTRAQTDEETKYDALIAQYKTIADNYPITVKMLAKTPTDGIVVGSTTLEPVTIADDGDGVTYEANGLLTPKDGNNPLYWQSNKEAYAFEATAHAPEAGHTVNGDQTTESNYFAQDYLKGYGYVKAWDTEQHKGVYNLDAPNYMTAHEWYTANTKAGLAPEGLNYDYYKTIPLYMQHQRAKISIILRAGEGVDRNQLEFDPDNNRITAKDQVKMEVYSYQSASTTVHPLLTSKDIIYKERDNSETHFKTACYEAIVEPHAYADNATEHKIASIEVSNLKFSFYAANDTKYNEYINKEDGEEKNSLLADIKSRYNLQAGNHLILDVTLSTADRKILITAYVVDWEEWPFITNCDDYGYSGKPIDIHNRYELIQFLKDPDKNKSGNIAFISPIEIDLEKKAEGVDADNFGSWPTEELKNCPLKATLTLAGAKLKLNHTLFPGGIESSGSLVNGILEFGNDNATEAIECAIAPKNKGSIERITVSNIRGSKVIATRGGLVTKNEGSIFRCTSNMPVNCADQTSDTYIGGIAAQSLYERNTSNEAITTTIPVIDQCTVNARVSGGTNVWGGGIVGQAEGKVTNNTFEYGITILQNANGARFQNIIAAKGSTESSLYNPDYVTGNMWPTSVQNSFSENDGFSNSRNTASLFTYVLDSEADLKELITNSAYKTSDIRVRLSNDFTVTKEKWVTMVGSETKPIGQQHEELTTSGVGNVFCEIDGNNCTICLDGESSAPMLFSNILNHVHDMTIVLLKDIQSEANESFTDAVAPLAYSVSSPIGKLSEIKVKSDKTVRSSHPSGLVVWAYNGATITNCQSNAKLAITLGNGAGEQAKYYVGGIINTAGEVTISRCTYHGGEDAFTPSQYGTVYYGGIVGGALKKDGKEEKDPKIEITDCNSWLTWTNANSDDHRTWGGIMGYAVFENNSHTLVNVLENCQGNWWIAPSAVAQRQSGKKEEDVIGKKNSVAPNVDTSYGNY